MNLELNDGQRAAVEYCDGPQLVIAGAGSGKTRVLTYKIAYLIDEKQYEPWSILALTFTNKAANEMRNRIARVVGQDRTRYLYMGTFHSIFSRILRVEAEKLGYSKQFTIYDESDSRSLLKSIIKEMQLDDKVYKPASVHAKISMAKNHLILPNAYAVDQAALKRDEQSRQGQIYQIYQTYQQRLQTANAMDFDDLLVLTWRLFKEHDDIRIKYAERFKYVLVDEYQDTNYVQQCIVLQLTQEHHHVCAVGDDAQSIYGFRGANIDNILDFQKIYPETKLFKLEQNYRSTQNIVQAANSLILHNKRQIHKDVYSRNAKGEKLVLRPVYSDKEEAAVVCRYIKQLQLKEHFNYSDFAILYRTNSQSRIFEEEMLRQTIPYRIFGGMSFYQRKEIKDVLAYFRVVVNPEDEEAIRRIINYPTRGIGASTIEKIIACAHLNHESFWSILSSPVKFGLKVNNGTLNKLRSFTELMSSFIEKVDTMDAYQLGVKIIQESEINKDIFSLTDPEAISRQENIEEFVNGLQDFVESRCEEGREEYSKLTDFLQEVSLLTDVESDDDKEGEKVSLMTIHAAKGLEFPTVFIVGMEENIFPSPMASSSARELEEERRLLYVAITRAEQYCFLTCAKNRWRYGKLEFGTPSRFLNEIDPAFMEIFSDDFASERPSRPVSPKPAFTTASIRPAHLKPVKIPPVVSKNHADQSTSQTISTADGLKIGCVIEHQRFGIGTVVNIEGMGENQKATVDFKNTGQKVLLLKFARYSIIE